MNSLITSQLVPRNFHHSTDDNASSNSIIIVYVQSSFTFTTALSSTINGACLSALVILICMVSLFENQSSSIAISCNVCFQSFIFLIFIDFISDIFFLHVGYSNDHAWT